MVVIGLAPSAPSMLSNDRPRFASRSRALSQSVKTVFGVGNRCTRQSLAVTEICVAAVKRSSAGFAACVIPL